MQKKQPKGMIYVDGNTISDKEMREFRRQFYAAVAGHSFKRAYIKKDFEAFEEMHKQDGTAGGIVR